MLSMQTLPGLPECHCRGGLHATSLLAALLCSAAAPAGSRRWLPCRPFLGDIQSMLEALPKEEAAKTTVSDAATGSDAEAGGTPDSLLSPAASEGPDSPSGKRPKGRSWFRGSKPTAAGLLSPKVCRPACCVRVLVQPVLERVVVCSSRAVPAPACDGMP